MQANNIINLLGIQGVKVKDIQKHKNSLEILIETKSKLQKCPSCNYHTKKVHDYRQQKIHHIQIGNCVSYLVLKKRRYRCHHCGKNFYEQYDFLQKYFRKSNAVFYKVVSELKQLKNFKTIANDNHVSIPTVVRFMNYEIFLSGKNIIKYLPKRIGIDEFKGNCNGNKYQVHIFDLDTHKTIDIIESRKYDDLERYFSTISNRREVEIVSMDLYSPFKRIIKDKLINAKIIADCFHFTRLVTNSLDELRLNIWRNSKGHERRYFKYLKHSLLKDISKTTDKDYEKLIYAFEFSPILKYAYELKQQFYDIKKLSSFEEKETMFRKWLNDADYSTINEFKSCVRTLRQWHEYISNYFRFNLSNGPTEGKNNLIKVIKRISFGFRNIKNFRNRILLVEL